MRVYSVYDPLWVVPFCFVLLIVLMEILAAEPNTGHSDNLARYEAREAEARADEARARAWMRWADNMPFILLMGGVAVAGVVVCLYRGRVAVETVRAGRDVQVAQIGQQNQPTHVTVNAWPDEAMRELREYAANNNKRIQSRGTDYYLIDNTTGSVQRVKPKQLTG
jgi:negative regulator of sigma E activity